MGQCGVGEADKEDWEEVVEEMTRGEDGGEE
jgi:hypothetical protein